MKVSETTGALKTSAGLSEKQPVMEIKQEGKAAKAVSGYFEDSYLDDPAYMTSGSGTAKNSGDPLTEHICFYTGGTGASVTEYGEVVVPDVAEIIAGVTENGDINVTDYSEFYDALEEKYLDLRQKVKKSITALEDERKKMPWAAAVVQKVIDNRRDAIRKIDEELMKMVPLRDALVNIYNEEMRLLTEYGKEYYKWLDAYQKKTDYTYTKKNDNGTEEQVTEKATLSNKPNPIKWKIDINNDGYIGGDKKTAHLFIGKKTVKEKKTAADGKIEEVDIEIYDIVDKTNMLAVSFSADGIVSGVASAKDKDFHWTITNGNLRYISDVNGLPDEMRMNNAIVLELMSTDKTYDNGLTNAPIGINIPEFIRVNEKTGEVIGVGEEGNTVVQKKADSTAGWVLKRVVKVIVEEYHDKESGKNYHKVELIGKDDDTLATIYIRGMGNTDSTGYALSLLAANEDDARYKRMSGIVIDAHKMSSRAEFKLGDEALWDIKQKYGIPTDSDPPSVGVFNSVIDCFKVLNSNTGIIVEGFHNVGLDGTNGNDIVLLEEAVEEYKSGTTNYKGMVDNIDTSAKAPLYTSAIKGRNGTDAIFHKSGHLYATNVSFLWSQSKDDNISISTNQQVSVYIETETMGEIDIANGTDLHKKGEDFGKNDDYYGIRSNSYTFANWFEPEVMNRKHKSTNKTLNENKVATNPPPLPGAGEPMPDAEDIGIGADDLCDPNEIRQWVDLQIDGLEHELRNQELDEDYDSLFDTGAYELTGYAGDLEREMDAAFAAFDAYFGSMPDDNALMAEIDKTFKEKGK